MALIKVTNAQGVILDWLVGVAEGDHVFRLRIGRPTNWKGVEAEPDAWEPRAEVPNVGWFADFTYNPSVNWAQGGPIKEREGIATRRSKGKWYAMLSDDLGDGERAQWCLYTFRGVPKGASTSRRCRFDGDTELQAAMRCYVASKLGDEAEVPDELLR